MMLIRPEFQIRVGEWRFLPLGLMADGGLDHLYPSQAAFVPSHVLAGRAMCSRGCTLAGGVGPPMTVGL